MIKRYKNEIEIAMCNKNNVSMDQISGECFIHFVRNSNLYSILLLYRSGYAACNSGDRKISW